eukprot:14581142-Alexandrium_andersonii.AAC.1
MAINATWPANPKAPARASPPPNSVHHPTARLPPSRAQSADEVKWVRPPRGRRPLGQLYPPRPPPL